MIQKFGKIPLKSWKFWYNWLHNKSGLKEAKLKALSSSFGRERHEKLIRPTISVGSFICTKDE